MGLEFIRRAAKAYRKGLDRRRVELGTPNLFTRQPGSAPRSYAALLRTGVCLTAGEELCVRFYCGRLVAFRGLDPVAEFDAPPVELTAAMTESQGEACGIVEDVHEIAGTAEISVC